MQTKSTSKKNVKPRAMTREDALAAYAAGPEAVVNPVWRKFDGEIRKRAAKLVRRKLKLYDPILGKGINLQSIEPTKTKPAPSWESSMPPKPTCAPFHPPEYWVLKYTA